VNATEAAAWFALALALLELAFIVTLVVLVLRFWRQVAPTVAPMLSMFAPPASSSSSSEAASALDRIADAIEAGEHDGGAL